MVELSEECWTQAGRPRCPLAVEQRGRRLGSAQVLGGGHGGSVTVLTHFILC